MSIELISEGAWREIERIQERAYTEISAEDVEILRGKWLISPSTCFVYTTDCGSIIAYLLSHPWSGEKLPQLNDSAPINRDSAILLLHDMAVSPDFQGNGIAQAMVKNLIFKARSMNFVKIKLIAVQNSVGFWACFGFKEVVSDFISSDYGKSAKSMALIL